MFGLGKASIWSFFFLSLRFRRFWGRGAVARILGLGGLREGFCFRPRVVWVSGGSSTRWGRDTQR